MAYKLEEGETFSAEVVFHINEKDLTKILREEIDKALVVINERIEEYLRTHIRARMLE